MKKPTGASVPPARVVALRSLRRLRKAPAVRFRPALRKLRARLSPTLRYASGLAVAQWPGLCVAAYATLPHPLPRAGRGLRPLAG